MNFLKSLAIIFKASSLKKKPSDFYYMLVQMTDEFYPLLQAHQNTTELDVDEEMTIYGDAENLARVFNNILKNAVAYSYPGTVIKISAKQTDTEVQIYGLCGVPCLAPALSVPSALFPSQRFLSS